MKIRKQSKQAVKACDVMPAPNSQVVGDFTDIAAQSSPYDQAKCFIQSAIGSLSTVAPNDPIAKDSIANLAVVLFDLQGSMM